MTQMFVFHLLYGLFAVFIQGGRKSLPLERGKRDLDDDNLNAFPPVSCIFRN